MESAWCTVNKLRIIKTRLTPTRKTQEAFLFEKSNDLLKSDTIFKKYIPKYVHQVPNDKTVGVYNITYT